MEQTTVTDPRPAPTSLGEFITHTKKALAPDAEGGAHISIYIRHFVGYRCAPDKLGAVAIFADDELVLEAPIESVIENRLLARAVAGESVTVHQAISAPNRKFLEDCGCHVRTYTGLRDNPFELWHQTNCSLKVLLGAFSR